MGDEIKVKNELFEEIKKYELQEKLHDVMEAAHCTKALDKS